MRIYFKVADMQLLKIVNYYKPAFSVRCRGWGFPISEKNAFSVDRPITLAPMRLKYPCHYSLFIRTFVRSQIIMDISSHFIVIKSLQIFSSDPIARKEFDINIPF
jgi:hypothetical protein